MRGQSNEMDLNNDRKLDTSAEMASVGQLHHKSASKAQVTISSPQNTNPSSKVIICYHMLRAPTAVLIFHCVY